MSASGRRTTWGRAAIGTGAGGKAAGTASATGFQGTDSDRTGAAKKGPPRTDTVRTGTTCGIAMRQGSRRATLTTARARAGSAGTVSSRMCVRRRAAGSRQTHTRPAAARRVAVGGTRGARWGALAPTTAQPREPRAMHMQAWVARERAELWGTANTTRGGRTPGQVKCMNMLHAVCVWTRTRASTGK